TGEDGRIVKFLEKPSWGEVFSDTINTGIYVIEPRVLERFGLGEVFDFSKDLFPRLLAEGEPLFGYVAEGYWTDVGSIAEYARANADLLRGKVQCDDLGHELMPGVWTAGDVDINESAKLTGPIFLGEGVKIGPHAEIIGPTVLRDYVSVDVGAIIDSSIVWRNTYIGERSELHGALVGRQCALKSRVILEEGSVIGDHTIVGDHARVRAQVKVWPDKQIESGAVIGSSLIWGAQGRRGLFGRCGVHVRVSPFDVRVCDVKFFDRQALDMDRAQERKVETIFFREDLRRVSYEDVGRIFESPRVGEAYSEAFLAEVARRKEIAEAKPKI